KPVLHSFPTRRSSDLIKLIVLTCLGRVKVVLRGDPDIEIARGIGSIMVLIGKPIKALDTSTVLPCAVNSTSSLKPIPSNPNPSRSEEHTSELQSRENL